MLEGRGRGGEIVGSLWWQCMYLPTVFIRDSFGGGWNGSTSCLDCDRMRLVGQKQTKFTRMFLFCLTCPPACSFFFYCAFSDGDLRSIDRKIDFFEQKYRFFNSICSTGSIHHP